MNNIWLDCDPGHDDAMAILMGAFHPEINLLGITTVAGNQAVEKTCANARAFLAALSREDIPVYRGQASALLSPSSLSRGQTVCDFYGRSTEKANCRVALKVDVAIFWDEMLECLERAEPFFVA